MIDSRLMNTALAILLRAFLILIFLGCLLWQVWVVPTLAQENASQFPEVAFLAAPYAAVVIIGIACMQTALVAIWKLLSLVERRTIFNQRAFVWVNTIIGAIALATVLVLGLGIHLLGIINVGGPGIALAVMAATVCGIAFLLLMLVMKGLLRGATSLEDELAEVV